MGALLLARPFETGAAASIVATSAADAVEPKRPRSLITWMDDLSCTRRG
jgi:hypothetical protein